MNCIHSLPLKSQLRHRQADEHDAAVLDARWAEMLQQRGAAKPARVNARTGKRPRSEPASAAATAASPERPAAEEAEVSGGSVQAGGPAAVPMAAPAARPLRLVGVEQEAALLAPLHALWAHREGVVDMSDAVAAAVEAGHFPGDRCLWATDLQRMAGRQKQQSVALRLAALVSSPA